MKVFFIFLIILNCFVLLFIFYIHFTLIILKWSPMNTVTVNVFVKTISFRSKLSSVLKFQKNS